MSLLGAIDDATGEVAHALFRQQEDAHGYFLLLSHIVLTKGCPLALYRDRHGIFEPLSTQPLSLDEQLAGRREPTQFGRLLQELEITSIGAHSPQAKGPIERLWGTFQDRLVAELCLAGVNTLEEANRFLPLFLADFNRRFAVPAAEAGSAYRPLPPGLEPDTVFCFKYRRTVAADNTVRLEEHRLQLLPGRQRSSYARAHVEVQERLDGSLAVYYEGRLLASKPAPVEAPVLRARKRHKGGLNRVAESDYPQRLVPLPSVEPAPAAAEAQDEGEGTTHGKGPGPKPHHAPATITPGVDP